MDAAQRSPFRVVQDSLPPEPVAIFCGHCGRSPESEQDTTASRVCAKCGLGLLLQTPVPTAPSASDPFLVVDGSLTICALSRQAEKLLGTTETDAVNRHIAEFLVPGDAEDSATETLAALLTWAARGESPSKSVVVRPTNTFGVRYWARVGPCGPPTAALLVLADAR